LQVPEDLIGKSVQCPECKHTFTAAVEEEQRISTVPTPVPAPAPPTPKTPEWDKKASSRSSKPGKKRRSEDDDEYDVEERDEDEDDDDYEERRRRRRRSSSNRARLAPHRGSMILAFGIISLVGGLALGVPVIFGLVAWIMGNTDLNEMREGRMDPEGEGMTQAGRIMGMIATILAIVGTVLFCGLFGCAILLPIFAVGAGAANQRPPMRRN